MGEVGQPECAYRHLERSNTEVAEVSGSSRIRFYPPLGGHTAVLRVPLPPRPGQTQRPSADLLTKSERKSQQPTSPPAPWTKAHSSSQCVSGEISQPGPALRPSDMHVAGQRCAVRLPVAAHVASAAVLSATRQWGHSEVSIGFALHVKK